MKTLNRDMKSFVAIVDSFIDYAKVETTKRVLLKNELKRYIITKFEKKKYIHPIITKFSTDWFREFYRLVDNQDPYAELKDESNKKAKEILPLIKITSFEDMIKVSLKGNQIDYGAVLVLNYDLNKLEDDFQHLDSVQFDIDDSLELKKAIDSAKNVLFLVDNDGEIIFDTFLLDYIKKRVGKENVSIVAKESPMLNDVTIADLKSLNMQEYGHLVSTGSNCFGLHEEDVSENFKKILKNADLIIAKGQAYLEFFTEYNFSNVYNIVYVKYPIVDEALGVLQSHQKVVLSSKRYASKGKSYDFGMIEKENANKKIISRQEIGVLAKNLRSQGKKIVTINGSYDILHLGHIKMLEEAKNQGDILIVGINSDSSIHEYKSPYRPINNENIRAEFMSAIQYVDYVFVFPEVEPMVWLEEVKPDVHVNGSEYGENCIEAETVQKNGGRVHIANLVSGFSTTDTIKKVNDVNKNAKEEIISVLQRQNGILFGIPAMVHRLTYSGRDIIAKNSSFEKDCDNRGYVPVEWWIMSLTHAQNDKKKQGEGYTFIMINDKKVFLKEVLNYVDVLGKYKKNWPLTKILDIGGKSVKTSFGEEEVPPIPAHVHSGLVKNGKIIPPGKLEAYFFPPVGVPPYNKDFGKVITRLGLIPSVTKEQFIDALKNFGKSDDVYSLCTIYEIKPYDGWTIPQGTVHAPGPWITFEIQRAQDDYNLLAWQLGQRFSPQEQENKKVEQMYRGLKNEEDVLLQAVDWNTSTDPHFKENHYRPSRVIEQGKWGRRMQIFFDQFYGEALEINPNETYVREADELPFAGIVWSGKGIINDNILNVDNIMQKEFLVTPYTMITLKNTGNTPLLIYTVFPIKE